MSRQATEKGLSVIGRCVAVALALLLAACQSGADEAVSVQPRPTVTPVVVQGGDYASQEHDYGLTFPDGWQVRAEEFGLDVIGMRPAVPETRFRSNVNVVVERVPDMTLVRWTRLAAAQTETVIDGYRSVATSRSRLGGQPAWEHRFTGVQDGTPVTFLQVSTLRGGRAYVMTAVSASGEFRSSLDEFRRIIDSFAFEGPAPSS
ncbi:MAG: hypothetical protein ACR2MA_02150 [Egibacteraceae bacterium]